jgi:stage V sporulation protein D (sporulation-specific penicillin-binding protein)
MAGRASYVLIRKRLLGSFAVFAVFLVFLISRLAWLQLVRGGELQDKASAQWNRRLTVQPQRGSIYDRNGSLLAGSATAETIVAIPREIRDVDATARALAPILGIREDILEERMSRNIFEIFLKRKVDDDVAQRVKELRLPGIRTTIESKRFYPRGNLASHVLGFVGIDEGLEGIEFAYESVLKGKAGFIIFEGDASGRQLPEGLQAYLPPINGNSLYLTIDAVIQHIVERELDRAMQTFLPKAAAVLAIDPNTGEILALAARPDYYPERYADFPASNWRNPIISNSFEPGSTFKIITISAAKEENVVDFNSGFFCPGFHRVGDRILRCWRRAGHGSQSFSQVVWNSCNPGFMSLGLRLGTDKLFEYIQGFGFGASTGIDLPGEAVGILFNPKNMSQVDLAVTSFGQGNAVTPIQQVMAVAAVANGGTLLQPRIVREVRDEKGNLVQGFQPHAIRRIITQETAREVTDVLAQGIQSGTGRFAAVEGYSVAGKTGTAQKIAPGGGYAPNAHILSFIGFAPAENPQILIYVMVDEPSQGPQWGSQVAAPIFRAIATDVLRYLGVPPNRELPAPELPVQAQVPNLVNLTVEQARDLLEDQGFSLRIEGEGDVILAQVPKPGAMVPVFTTIVAFTSGGNPHQQTTVTVPDLTGLSMRDAADILAMLNLRMDTSGTGFAVEQSPLPGTKLNTNSTIRVIFRPPGT